MSDVRITLTQNPGLSKDEILKILASYGTITPEAIADVILANNKRIALRINTCMQSTNL